MKILYSEMKILEKSLIKLHYHTELQGMWVRIAAWCGWLLAVRTP